MQLERMAVLGGIVAVGAAVLIDRRMAFAVRVQHGLVDAAVGAFVALEWLQVLVLPDMVFQMMFELGDERALGALQDLLGLHVRPGMLPEGDFGDGY